MRTLKPRLSEKKHVIWDWNGTLLNDAHLSCAIVGELLTEVGLEPITLDEHRQKFRFPLSDYYESLGFDLKTLPFEVTTRSFVKRYNERVRSCELFEGARELIEDLARNEGVGSSILSAANQKDLMELLQFHNIVELFENVVGLPDHNAASKIEQGKELLSRLEVEKEEVILVGDTDHDWEVAETLGVDCLLLGDGHQCPTRLRSVHHQVIESRFETGSEL